jgi:DNA repair exonuclease SbcCD ATPase subunit
MSDKVRDTLGKFAPKSVVPRKVRSVNLKDEAWQWLVTVAEKAGMSRNDYLEALAQGNSPFMETAKSQFQPFIEMVPTKTKTDAANIRQQPNSKLFPFMETARTEVDSPTDEVEAVRAENQQLHIELGNSESEKESLKQELVEVRSQLKAERADQQKIEGELSDLEKNSAPAATVSEKLTPSAAILLSQLARQTQKIPGVPS